MTVWVARLLVAAIVFVGIYLFASSCARADDTTHPILIQLRQARPDLFPPARTHPVGIPRRSQ